MPFYFFAWTDEIIEHLAENGVTPEDFIRVLTNPVEVDRSRTTGKPASFGYTEDGRFIIAVYEFIDEDHVLPVTAYEIREPA